MLNGSCRVPRVQPPGTTELPRTSQRDDDALSPRPLGVDVGTDSDRVCPDGKLLVDRFKKTRPSTSMAARMRWAAPEYMSLIVRQPDSGLFDISRAGSQTPGLDGDKSSSGGVSGVAVGTEECSELCLSESSEVADDDVDSGCSGGPSK